MQDLFTITKNQENLDKLGIKSMQILAEKSLDPLLEINYNDGTTEQIRGYEEIVEESTRLLEELKEL